MTKKQPATPPKPSPTFQEDLDALRGIGDRMLNRAASAARHDAFVASEQCEDSFINCGNLTAEEFLFCGRAIHLVLYRIDTPVQRAAIGGK